MSAAISIEHVTFRYENGHQALNDVSLEVPSGKILSLVGRNGSGKTTLAKHVNALMKPTSGRVTVLGQPTDRKTASEMAPYVGYVFQSPEDQLFEATVREEVTFGPRNLGWKKEEIDDKVDAALNVVNLASYAHEHPYNLTYGERKMLCLAAVLAMDPQIFVMDEPNAGQDYFGILLLGSILEGLRKRGKTCVVVSHDMEFVAKHSDEVAVLEKGSILLKGIARDVLCQEKLLSSSAVVPPQITRLSSKLSSIGVRHDIVTVAEFVDEMTRLTER